nr:MAG TPA: hypothetical protein [Caudoviricetes sp.]
MIFWREARKNECSRGNQRDRGTKKRDRNEQSADRRRRERVKGDCRPYAAGRRRNKPDGADAFRRRRRGRLPLRGR